ncbi:hypothetical protein BATDEDRAFT_23817 [Batrachochytrium dendrobatidis JAM81]|uniref:Rad21/Rec8-like protein N-terminal domain-containing protein n=1 Tax=Batrachochytrium dendrobatidis (strain JAM81 / FGSC 10211) TaxID=684364 RepID=F4P0A4_BATDJ|nr:uncharacterized protein BATDEDRAFT_23817 [Batrachochytrium dendrobatidis JAM81]EGF81414.1 hypothetical protein BATDEDRAFT_23817 [Batrachochytrium dendrobatidis JAM81]|eukprot:XP_006677846.1 hypothetical protein BATDEDRAFT_23817 [Batrachochytrium dendrobatidis JAM81]
MFYSETILAKKGPLAKVWLAAHWERKLSKTQFLQTNIQNSITAILGTNGESMALRLTGQLLLGVVRIFSRKARYLLEDCNEALIKIKMIYYSIMQGVSSWPLLSQKTTAASALNMSRMQDITLIEPAFFSASQREDLLADPVSNEMAVGMELEDNAFDLHFENEVSTAGVELGRDAVPVTPFHLDNPDQENTMDESKHTDTSIGQLPLDVSVTGSRLDLLPDITFNQNAPDDPLLFAGEDNYDFGFGDASAIVLNVDKGYNETHLLHAVIREIPQVESEMSHVAPEEPDNQEFFRVPTLPFRKRAGEQNELARKKVATQRKRKVVVDEEIDLADQIVRQQLQDPSDILDSDTMPMFSREYICGPFSNNPPPFFDSIVCPPESLRRFEFNTGVSSNALLPNVDNYGLDDNYDPFQGLDNFEPVPETLDFVVENSRQDESILENDKIQARDSLEPIDAKAANMSVENDLSIGNYSADIAIGSFSDMPQSIAEISMDHAVVAQSAKPADGFHASLYEFGDATETPADNELELSKHTYQTIKILQERFNQTPEISPATYSEFVQGASKTIRARFFFELLVLKTKKLISVEQKAPYDDILILPETGLLESVV